MKNVVQMVNECSLRILINWTPINSSPPSLILQIVYYLNKYKMHEGHFEAAELQSHMLTRSSLYFSGLPVNYNLKPLK